MNRKVFVSMLTLSIACLLIMYILKIFFPNEFLFAVENPRIVAVGEYIDNHPWAYYALGIITSFATYWLYLCAVCKKLYLNWKECLLVLFTIGLTIALGFVSEKLVTYINVCGMIILPFIMKANLKEVAIVYSVHGLAQILSLGIRSLPLNMENVCSLTLHMVGSECYLWLVLFYIILNYKKQEE